MTETDRFRRLSGDKNLTPAELVRACGQKLTDAKLWEKFQQRWRRVIFGFLLRALHFRGINEDQVTLADDLAQDVYVRLVQNDGRMMRTFKGETEFEAAAFLARVCASAVEDYWRKNTTIRRGAGEVVSINNALGMEDSAGIADVDRDALLSWIDVQRLVEADSDRRNAARNVLIFKLHFIDGLTVPEIAQYPGFNLTEEGVESVVHRLKTKLKKKIDY